MGVNSYCLYFLQRNVCLCEDCEGCDCADDSSLFERQLLRVKADTCRLTRLFLSVVYVKVPKAKARRAQAMVAYNVFVSSIKDEGDKADPDRELLLLFEQTLRTCCCVHAI